MLFAVGTAGEAALSACYERSCFNCDVSWNVKCDVFIIIHFCPLIWTCERGSKNYPGTGCFLGWFQHFQYVVFIVTKLQPSRLSIKICAHSEETKFYRLLSSLRPRWLFLIVFSFTPIRQKTSENSRNVHPLSENVENMWKQDNSETAPHEPTEITTLLSEPFRTMPEWNEWPVSTTKALQGREIQKASLNFIKRENSDIEWFYLNKQVICSDPFGDWYFWNKDFKDLQFLFPPLFNSLSFRRDVILHIFDISSERSKSRFFQLWQAVCYLLQPARPTFPVFLATVSCHLLQAVRQLWRNFSRHFLANGIPTFAI